VNTRRPRIIAAECRAVWKALADFDEQTRLFPDGLLAYLRKH
jgi:hypothetical protein